MADVELDTLGATIKEAYEGEANTNAFTDTEKAKLAGVAPGAEVNTVDSVNGQTGSVTLDADDIGDGTTAKQYTQTEKSKLAGIATAATANSTDAQLRDRTTHTGVQPASTISDFSTEVDARITAQKAQANGLATLGGDGKVPNTQLPSYVDDVLEFANFAAFPGTGESGKIYFAIDTGHSYRWGGSAYIDITGGVTTVNGESGAVTLDKADIGLANVDNTSDLNKPVSTAVQAQLDAIIANNPILMVDNTGVTDVGPAITAAALANGGIVILRPGVYYVGTAIDPGTSGGSLKLYSSTGQHWDVEIQHDPGTPAIAFNNSSSATIDPIVFEGGQGIAATTATITGITQATVGVATTAAPHGFALGEIIKLTAIDGMVELNNRVVMVGKVTASTFEIWDVNGAWINTTAYTAYTANGTATRYFALAAQQLNGQDYLHKVAVSNAAVYKTNDIVHIHSQDIIPAGSDRIAGEAASVVWVDYQNNIIYLNSRLHGVGNYFSSPRISRYKGNQEFLVQGITFTAKGNYLDPQYGTRYESISIYAVPYATIKGCRFTKLWSQGPIFRGCPYMLYDDNVCDNMPNNLAYDSTATVRTITAATQANPVVITTSASHGFNNDDVVYIANNVGGMTQIRNQLFIVANKTTTTFELLTLNKETVNGLGFSAFTSGGSVGKAVTVKGLGYGVSVYGPSHGGVVSNSNFRQCRHAVTTDGAGDASYTTTESYRYGQPSDVTCENLVAHDCWGIPFDTHEEGYNIVFRNCRYYFPTRGASGGSYDGIGFQIRCASSTIEDCGGVGGLRGVLYRAIAHSFAGQHMLKDFDVRNTAMQQAGGSVNQDGAVLIEDQNALTYPAMFTVIDPHFRNTGKAITLGKSAKMMLINGIFRGCDIGVDITAGSEFKHYGTAICDYRQTLRSVSNARAFYVRSDAILGGGTCELDRVHIRRGYTTNNPVSVIAEGDTTAAKFYNYNEIIDDNPGLLAPVVIITTSSTTMRRIATSQKSVTRSQKSVTLSTYTILHTDNGQDIYLDRATDIAITVPNYLPAGFTCNFIQLQAGAGVFTAAGGATQIGMGGAALVAANSARTKGINSTTKLFVKTNTGADANYIVSSLDPSAGILGLTDAATIATNADLGESFSVTLAGNRTLGAPTNLRPGKDYTWKITQDGTGNRTLAYNAVFKFSGGTPVLSTAAGAVDILKGWSDGTNIYAELKKAFA